MKLLKKLNSCFDYVFYRTAVRDKKSGGSTSAAHVNVVGLQLFLIIIIIGLVVLLGCGRQNITHLISLDMIKLLIVIAIIILSVYNYSKYKGRYYEFHERWKDEPKQKKRLNGLLIILSYVVLIIGMIGLSFIPD